MTMEVQFVSSANYNTNVMFIEIVFFSAGYLAHISVLLLISCSIKQMNDRNYKIMYM